jgi:hypothetical protein
MSAPLQLSLAITQPHRNRYLFSDHYLNQILPRDPRWEAALDQAEDFLAWLQALYAQEQKQLPKYHEAQLEDHWIRPILEKLGHVFEGQASVPGLDEGVKMPDYVFFPDEAARQQAVGAQKTEEYTARALAVGEVKRWDTPLGKKQRGGGASFEAQNPSWQIDRYIRDTGLDWGILSDGRLWRLVHRDSSQRLSIYYEVDLSELLARGDARALRYFTLFFRQAAFRPDGQGRVFLQDALAASEAYALALEEDLETNVYHALERLMQGFLDLPQNGLGAGDLRAIYENSLYLLYRLLFILYGESRGLLPLHMHSYKDNYSLDAVKREIAMLQTPLAPMTTNYWGRLQNLFQIINGDNAALNRHLGVPRYNGGLFDPQLHPFLEQKAVGDRALVEAIDLLSRRKVDGGSEFVDYRTLGVRHLGSIYEGLLEYQPRIAREPVAAVGGQWVETSEVSENLRGLKAADRRDVGQVYLETDRGERKATGSYYTPQYIVEYIVAHTLGPLVDEARRRVIGRAKEAESDVHRAGEEQSFIDEVLALKVLDPAMGSGHFLVEATEFLALALATDPYVETAAGAEEDLAHWRRRVVERCIYGVDRNPLAVELAKLSLWLATVAVDKPLSFLDHHLKCGDSLVGARVADLGWAPPPVLSKKAQKQIEQQKAGQVNMFEYTLSQMLPTAMGRILEITEVDSDSYETVQAKEAADRAVRKLKEPFRAVADLWTSAYFGNAYDQGDYDEALGLIGQGKKLLALEPVQRAEEMAGARRFFHWELAFPEVFYDRHGQRLGEQAGFDAVVGNPPYIQLSMQPDLELGLKDFLLFRYESSMGRLNTFGFFTKGGIELLRTEGWWSMIIPNTYLTMPYYKELREFMLDTCKLNSIVTFENLPFDEAVVENVVIVASTIESNDQAIQSKNTVSIYQVTQSLGSPTIEKTHSIPQEIFSQLYDFTFNPTITPAFISLHKDMIRHSRALGELCEVNQAIALKHDRAKWLFDHKGGPDFKRLLDGRDIGRYSIQWSGTFLKYDLKAIHSCKREDIFLANEKILFRRVGNRIIACFDNKQFYALNTLVVVTTKTESDLNLRFLLTLLNSALLDWYYITFLKSTKEVFSEIQARQIEQLPIRLIEFTTPKDAREALAAEGEERAEEAVKALAACGAVGSGAPMDRAVALQAAAPALDFVTERLQAQPEQADVVHDLLAHLAGEMIALHEKKQARTESFWLDLEGVTDADTFAKLQKGKQGRTLWKRSKPCRPFVSEESHSTHSLDESLGWGEGAFKDFVKALAGKVQHMSDLVGVYRDHAPAYADLVARIAATDWLIDRIVYALYGLTEEEIAIVEKVGKENLL